MSALSRLLFIALCCFSFATPSFANTPPFGATYSYLLVPKDPSHLKGYRFSLWYQPQSLIWSRINIYFDASAGHWWSNYTNNQSINIFALAPVFRFYFAKTPLLSPYGELSIGPAYLSRTRLNTQNLGMHFAFQDQVTLGSAFGKEQRLTASVTTIHYSNASLAARNSGITIPVLLNLSYRFG